MHFTLGSASHVGKVRTINEDSFLAASRVAAVADGMGGHACGDVASQVAKAALSSLSHQPTFSAADVRQAILDANSSILNAGRTDTAKAGMGTTITGIALVEHFGNPHYLVFNVGDSRVYRIAGDGSCEQLTQDHSEVAELVAAGRITAEQALTHPLRNVVTRSLGMDPPPRIDTWLSPPHAGDTFLVCSDGLTNEVSESEITQIVGAAETPQKAADDLVNAALKQGARDNVTIIVVRTNGDTTDVDDTLVDTRPRKSLKEES